jgi:hypothetical protein
LEFFQVIAEKEIGQIEIGIVIYFMGNSSQKILMARWQCQRRKGEGLFFGKQDQN